MKELAEEKKEEKGKGYQLSNQQAEENSINNIGRLFVSQGDYGIDFHCATCGDVAGEERRRRDQDSHAKVSQRIGRAEPAKNVLRYSCEAERAEDPEKETSHQHG